MKQQPGRVAKVQHGLLSGVSCPGLIEAWMSPSGAIALGRAYPGFLAPASLKRSDAGVGGVLRFAYPGFLAPASLKQERNEGIVLFFSTYPGFLAPASLKLVARPGRTRW